MIGLLLGVGDDVYIVCMFHFLYIVRVWYAMLYMITFTVCWTGRWLLVVCCLFRITRATARRHTWHSLLSTASAVSAVCQTIMQYVHSNIAEPNVNIISCTKGITASSTRQLTRPLLLTSHRNYRRRCVSLRGDLVPDENHPILIQEQS